ncbi:MAG: cytochrome b/b6 domain-containing protein [Alphaproteobacteria bacterium]|uniref:Cytochrome b/b6 domain-containing protein n=1 Tax=Candidatus Nitrobium versatile TaxID=2884831 RepID=A0A953M377_9BACT|nr:cytochrome b/b6 domain-containing protein [Candidatus Nitrobium versatile]
MKEHDTAVPVRRFHPYRIFEHWSNALAFTLLVITGLSQKFHEFETAQNVILFLGGIDATRLLHRYTGIFFTVLTLQHILVAAAGILFLKWQPSMVIHKKDFTDAIDNLRYYFGLSESPARCDRYDYKQKFEYWGVVVGGVLMIATGLALWFPAVVSRYVPGALIPVSKALHTNEALLAFLVIIIWHIYNAVFSPEVFPIDTAMFTGKISKQRMHHEHPIEYERLFGTPAGESEKSVPETETAT